MKLRHILVGIDFSEQSDAALDAALRLARRGGGRLTLLHVLPSISRPLTSIEDADSIYERRLRELPEEARLRLEQVRERLAQSGIAAEIALAEGPPYAAIEERAAELDVDLVVVGNRGLHGFERLRLGSVAERVVRIAPASVLVSRGHPGEAGYRRVLVPVDLSARSAPALDAAIDVADPAARITVFHRYEIPPGANLPSYRRALAAGSLDLGEALVRPFSERHAGLGFESEEGRAAPGILDRLEGGDYDLVVLGSHGRRGMRRWLLGSVAEGVVRHAPCSALVVREKGRA